MFFLGEPFCLPTPVVGEILRELLGKVCFSPCLYALVLALLVTQFLKKKMFSKCEHFSSCGRQISVLVLYTHNESAM